MKYLAIETMAVDEIVSERFLQSTEFAQGEALVDIILGGPLPAHPITARLQIDDIAGGRVVTFGGRRNTDSKWLVIDVDQCALGAELVPSDILFAFQKLCRFCKKIWGSLSLNFAEQLIKGSSKAVLFPFQQYKPVPYRIVMEREPWNDRLSKRGQKGNFLLAYKAGHVSGNAAREEPELTNFRKAFEALTDNKSFANTEIGKKEVPRLEIKQLQVANLAENVNSFGSMYRSFDDWLGLLTAQQQRFVGAEIVGPHRIEGAAGTGKTLCLMLKAILALRRAKEAGKSKHYVFVTHSDATRRSITDVVAAIDENAFYAADRNHDLQTLRICTLSDICGELLRQSISESEYIDRDAMESKALQLLYIEEALNEAMTKDFSSHQKFLSQGFASFIGSEERATIADMLQHEISVIIKGRASEDWDTYRKVPPLKYGIPTENESDKGFVFTVFRYYQSQLKQIGQFDTDDVVLTAKGQLDTPIWRRRRSRDGYDAVFIDETHLFNINELHIFHFFTNEEMKFPIVYSVDRSQAVGDRGWTTQDITAALADDGAREIAGETIKTVFRSSPEVVSLAFSIVAAGATLFTNFDNPMDLAISGFTEAEERLAATPVYHQVANETAMIEAAFQRVEALQNEMNCKKSDILLVSLDENVVAKLESFAIERHKAHYLLKRRGDLAAIKAARDASQVIIGHADYVGGLEFLAVVIVGVDGGRVPPTQGNSQATSKNYLSYASHNRLYVAVSRAKYRVEMIGEKARGRSSLVEPAIEGKLMQVDELNV
jgi:hypothetical protein